MSVIPLKGLNEEQARVQARSLELFHSHKRGLIQQYRSRYGVLVGTDLAQEMFPDYARDRESRFRFAAAVQRAAAALADAIFDEIVSQSSGGVALFTAGGTGAGKTSSIMRDDVARPAFLTSTVIFDGNFNSVNSSKSKIDSVLARGCEVVVIFVHRHPVEAYLQGVIPRAKEQGRSVPVSGHIRMHKDSLKTCLKVGRHFADNPKVSFRVLNNTGHEQESFRSTIDYLKAVRYDFTVLEATIRKALQHELAEKRISEALYESACGTSGVEPDQPIPSGA